MIMVDDSTNTEITMTRLANKKGNKRFIKIGNALLTPKMIWDDCLKNHRRVDPQPR